VQLVGEGGVDGTCWCFCGEGVSAKPWGRPFNQPGEALSGGSYQLFLSPILLCLALPPAVVCRKYSRVSKSTLNLSARQDAMIAVLARFGGHLAGARQGHGGLCQE